MFSINWASRCSECGSTDKVVIQQEAECVCRNCGLVIEQRMIDESYIAYSSTPHSYMDRCEDGTCIQGLLKKTNDKIQSKPKIVTRNITKEFEDIVSDFDTNTIHVIEDMFSDVLKMQNMKGNNRRMAYATCVYFSLDNKSMNDVSNLFGCKKNFPKIFNMIRNLLIREKKWRNIVLNKNKK